MFRRLNEKMLVAGQITPEDVAEAAGLGVRLIINNRPEGEAPDQPSGASIKAAADAAGLGYAAIPVSPAGIAPPQIDAMAEALSAADGPILAFCRSGTRSTLLWSLARARAGEDPAQLATTAMAAGYDLSPIAPQLATIAAAARRS